MIRYNKTKVLSFTIFGNLPRKSNQRRKAANGQIIKSIAAIDYSKSFMTQIKPEWQLRIAEPCRLEVICYYRNKLSDLSDELLADLCEKCDIIIDDNLFREKELCWQHDPKCPRVEVVIFRLEDYPKKWLKKSKIKANSPGILRPQGRQMDHSPLQLQYRQPMFKGSRVPRMTQRDYEELLTRKETKTAENKQKN